MLYTLVCAYFPRYKRRIDKGYAFSSVYKGRKLGTSSLYLAASTRGRCVNLSFAAESNFGRYSHAPRCPEVEGISRSEGWWFWFKANGFNRRVHVAHSMRERLNKKEEKRGGAGENKSRRQRSSGGGKTVTTLNSQKGHLLAVDAFYPGEHS